MSFAVVGYFAFLLIGLVVYYLIPRKFSWIWLLMLSYIYYFTFNIRTSLYMVSTTLFIYFGGLALNKVIDNGNTYLKENDYQGLFKRANIILLAYPNSFKYQVSGVSYECVANNKKMLVLKNPSLSYCIYFYNYDIFFENANDVIRHIIKMKNHSKDYKCTASPKDLSPNYSIILD